MSSCDKDKYYTITLDCGEEESPRVNEYKEDSNIYFPNLVKDGYVFKGWAEIENGNPIETKNVKATSDKTYYAIWARKCIIEYYDDISLGTQKYEIGTVVPLTFIPPHDKPDKLIGWSLEKGGKICKEITIEEDIRVYAVWEKYEYLISFDINGGSGDTPNSIHVKNGDYLSYSNLPSQSGFSCGVNSFEGWSKQQNGNNIITSNFKPDDDMVLYAVWKNNGQVKPKNHDDEIKVYFNHNDGTSIQDTKTYVKKQTLTNSDFPVITRNRYVLKGWAVTSSGTPINSITLNNDTTIYAIWNPLYEISFDINGGEGTIPNSIMVEWGDKFTDFPNSDYFSRENYTFEGWSKEINGEVLKEVSPSSDMKLYAVWNSSLAKVSFDRNDGTGISNSDIKYVEKGTNLTDLDFPTLSRENYILKGWALSTYGNPINSITVDNDITLYAIWNKIHTISFNINGGEGVAPNEKKIVNGTTFTDFPNNTGFYRTDYDFKGWSTTKDGDAITELKPSSDVELYAVWEQVQTMEDEFVSSEKVANYIENLRDSASHKIYVHGELTQRIMNNIETALFFSKCANVYLDLSNCYGLDSIYFRYSDMWTTKLVSLTLPTKNVKKISKIDLESQLRYIEIPNTVTEIRDFAFDRNENLTIVKIPNSVTTIGSRAFGYCTNLLQIELPSTIKVLSESLFLSAGLKTFAVPKSVEIIESSVFLRCYNLTVSVPDNVKSIGECAFCSVKKVTFENPYNWYETTDETDWRNKQNGTPVTKLTEETYNSSSYYYKK